MAQLKNPLKKIVSTVSLMLLAMSLFTTSIQAQTYNFFGTITIPSSTPLTPIPTINLYPRTCKNQINTYENVCLTYSTNNNVTISGVTLIQQPNQNNYNLFWVEGQNQPPFNQEIKHSTINQYGLQTSIPKTIHTNSLGIDDLDGEYNPITKTIDLVAIEGLGYLRHFSYDPQTATIQSHRTYTFQKKTHPRIEGFAINPNNGEHIILFAQEYNPALIQISYPRTEDLFAIESYTDGTIKTSPKYIMRSKPAAADVVFNTDLNHYQIAYISQTVQSGIISHQLNIAVFPSTLVTLNSYTITPLNAGNTVFTPHMPKILLNNNKQELFIAWHESDFNSQVAGIKTVITDYMGNVKHPLTTIRANNQGNHYYVPLETFMIPDGYRMIASGLNQNNTWKAEQIDYFPLNNSINNYAYGDDVAGIYCDYEQCTPTIFHNGVMTTVYISSYQSTVGGRDRIGSIWK